MKTRLEILNDIEDELNCRLPINIFPSDVRLNDRWYSEEEYKATLEKNINKLKVMLKSVINKKIQDVFDKILCGDEE